MPTNFDNVPNRRRPGHVNKWTLHPTLPLPMPKNTLSMWLADMDFPAPRPILDALYKEVSHGVLGYDLASGDLLETVAARMDRLYRWKVDPETVVPVTGIVSGFMVAVRAFCTTEKGMMVQPPVYNHFFDVKKLGIPTVDVPFVRSVEGNILRYEIDWDLFRMQATKASMFLLCNPHNPLGILFGRKELMKMAEICLEKNVLLVADEIHSELLLDNHKFTPIATLSREIARNSITLVSASKTFNVAGLFCGFAIIPDKEIRAKYKMVVENLHMHVASLGLTASKVALSGKCDGWLKDLLRYLTENRNFLLTYVTENMPDVCTTIPQATYLGWLDFSSTPIQGSPFDFFMTKAKVAMSDGRVFGEGGEGHVRINFGTSRKLLAQGLERMKKALDKI